MNLLNYQTFIVHRRKTGTINIPKSIIRIGDSVFYNCAKLEEINYDGSVEEWNQIEKGKNWNYRVPAKVVHCIDGDAPLE